MTVIPTYHGYIGLTADAMLVVQQVLARKLPAVHQRPLVEERSKLICLGNVFVFVERHLGIRRWTDGVLWLLLRIVGRFLVYRTKHDDLLLPTTPVPVNDGDVLHDHLLIKKLLSITTTTADLNFSGEAKRDTIHLVLYYTPHDVVTGKLSRPVEDSQFSDVEIRDSLRQALRDSKFGKRVADHQGAYTYVDANHDVKEMVMPYPSLKRHKLAPPALFANVGGLTPPTPYPAAPVSDDASAFADIAEEPWPMTATSSQSFDFTFPATPTTAPGVVANDNVTIATVADPSWSQYPPLQLAVAPKLVPLLADFGFLDEVLGHDG